MVLDLTVFMLFKLSSSKSISFTGYCIIFPCLHAADITGYGHMSFCVFFGGGDGWGKGKGNAVEPNPCLD